MNIVYILHSKESLNLFSIERRRVGNFDGLAANTGGLKPYEYVRQLLTPTS